MSQYSLSELAVILARAMPKEVVRYQHGGWWLDLTKLPDEVISELPEVFPVSTFSDALGVLHWAIERATAKNWKGPW